MIRILPLLLLCAGCDLRENLVAPDLDLNRMIEQPRFEPFGASTFFADGMAMRTPPARTIPHGPAPRGRPPLTRDLVERGRDRFRIFCAPCHGLDGSGQTVVAANLPLVRPPDLHAENLRSRTDEQLHRVIGEGYGLMPRYGYQLDDRDRWAVIAWVRVLQKSRNVRLGELPPALRSRALEELGP